MKIINLSKNNPYHNKNILALKQVKKQGKEWSRITYQSNHVSLEKMAKCALYCSAATFGLGIPLVFSSFRTRLIRTFQLSEHVYSKKTLHEHFWKQIKESPSARAIYKKALSNIDKDEIPLSFYKRGAFKLYNGKSWPGCANFRKGFIAASLGYPEEKIFGTVLYETINLSQRKILLKISKEAKKGLLNANSFAKAFERVEYETDKIHHKVVKSSIKTNHWNPALDEFKDLPPTFKQEWKLIKHSAHTENYRQRYKKFYVH